MPQPVPEPVVRYVLTARVLHWVVAALILTMIPIGIWMTVFEPKDEQFKLTLYDIHQSIGMTVWVLMIWRAVVRWRNPPPPLPADMPALMRFAAHATHLALYVLIIIQPVIGFIGTSAWGFPPTWFWLVPIPDIVPQSNALGAAMSAVHLWGARAIIILIILHIAAALYHRFVRHDTIMARML